jgi:hypothetical protein
MLHLGLRPHKAMACRGGGGRGSRGRGDRYHDMHSSGYSAARHHIGGVHKDLHVPNMMYSAANVARPVRTVALSRSAPSSVPVELSRGLMLFSLPSFNWPTSELRGDHCIE